MTTITQQLNDAMNKKQRVIIKYQKDGQEKTYDVTPVGLENGLVVVAPLKGKNFNLTITKIINIDVMSGDDDPLVPLSRPSVEEFIEPQPIKPLGEPFTEVKTAAQWERLLKYYQKCLELENAQNTILHSKEVMLFPLEEKQVLQLLDARLTVVLDKQNPTDKKALMYLEKVDLSDQGLFLGYPLLTLPDSRVAPLVFAGLSIQVNEGIYRLQAEDAEINYAALSALGFADDDCEQIIDTCAQLRESGFGAILSALTNQIDELYPTPLPRHPGSLSGGFPKEPFQIYEGAFLFGADPQYTRSLLDELRLLMDGGKWAIMPDALRRLFGVTPEHDYGEVEPLVSDKSIYASRVNNQQRKALKATRHELLTVVTGPPGTGKSQLILNVIADAVIRGERVLFASRNNEAVNVVINRLHTDYQFWGAIRVGNRESLGAAGEMMLKVLDTAASHPELDDLAQLEREYFDVKLTLDQQEDHLQHINSSLNTQRELQDQFQLLLPRLPENFRNRILEYPHQLKTKAEKDALETLITSLIAQADRLVMAFRSGRMALTEALSDTSSPLIALIRDFEAKEGVQFGGGFLQQVPPADIEALGNRLWTWHVLVQAVRHKLELQSGEVQYTMLEQTYTEGIRKLPQFLQENADPILRQINSENFAQIKSDFQSLWDSAKDGEPRSIISLPRFNSTARLAKQLYAFLAQFGLNSPDKDAVSIIQGLRSLLSLYQDYHKLQVLGSQLREKKNVVDNSLSRLPEIMRDDFAQLDFRLLTGVPEVEKSVRALVSQHKQLQESYKGLLQSLDALLSPGNDFPTLSAFKVETKDGEWWDSSSYRTPARLLENLEAWQRVFGLWETNRKLKRLEQENSSRERLDAIRQEIGVMRKRLIEVSRNILHQVWFSRVLKQENHVLQGARNYAEATRALTSTDGLTEDDRRAYRHQRTTYLPEAMKVFPVWATTNLSAKSNFKLDAGLFDLAIIDEASQCDVPSALPLLFRAKRIVIIGDPNQLTHITRLQNSAQVNLRYGIDATFGYAEKSLFSLAEGSIGNRPGTILLEEHYRSHPRIIAFSNREFYGERLRILTDLGSRNLPPEYRERGVGLHWVDVPGKVVTRHQNGRGRYNPAELDTLKLLIPRIISDLTRAGLGTLSIGIVTPFREQKEMIARWVSEKYPNGDRIKVGTAHTFQGDERDIILFSLVMAEDMGGAQGWMDSNINLLNVALTRARNTLIVVGDWNYCRQLSPASKYRRLADLAEQYGVVTKQDAFSLI